MTTSTICMLKKKKLFACLEKSHPQQQDQHLQSEEKEQLQQSASKSNNMIWNSMLCSQETQKVRVGIDLALKEVNLDDFDIFLGVQFHIKVVILIYNL